MEFSLYHQTVSPKNGLDQKPPLLLLLHGFGANEDDLLSISPYLDERFFVIGARAPITLGSMSYAWFNLAFTGEGFMVLPAEIEKARQILRRFIDEIVSYYQVDKNAVYLMGFSQGAMMSLALALTFPGLAAGVVAMSGRLLSETIDQIIDKDTLIGLPIFVAHGTRDVLLPISHGRDVRDKLQNLPVDLTYREYDMAHEVSVEELRDVINWLSAQLDRASSAVTIN